MAESLQVQIEKLRASIRGLEAQRSALGDAIVEPALAVLRRELAGLEEQAAAQTAPTEERRLVTILFFDIVGSTSMAEKLDPEEWRQVVQRVHTTLGAAVSAHHGAVAQYLGDGLLAFFGSKEASEHDPENAVRAALDGHSAVTKLPAPEKVQLRAGIHTGLVVLGELGDSIHKEFTASGDAVNLAARLQSAAPPGGSLISHDTYRYVRGVFDMTPRPPLAVKGKSDPVQTYLVRRAKPRPFRSVARGVAGVETRTVGREAEMQALQTAYRRAFEGHGVVWAQLVSEPGMGKSRLLEDLSAWIDLREETTRLLRARAFPDDANQPFALVRRMWFDRFQLTEDAPLGQAEAKWVERYLDFCGQEGCEEAAHALGLLVGLPFKDSPYIGAMRSDPTQVKGRALVVSRELVQSMRQSVPLVVLLEDLQWADAASWEYLTEVFLGDAKVEQPNGLFILGAARTEWRPPEALAALFKASQPAEKTSENWGIQISLAPLPDQASRELAGELFQRAVDVPDQVIDLLVERSEGVPYFAEEIVNWLIDRGILDMHCEPWCFAPEKLKEEPLPPTLQHLLLTRLSSLSQPERAALQRGSIFGRHFWTGGVEALGVPGGDEVLSQLQPRGFVEAQPESTFHGDTEWSFHHNLLQEVTYESVLKRERAALHKVAAGWLERQARQAGRQDEFAGLLGEHYQRAGELSTAADWYLRAGNHAFGQGATRSAKDFYTQALELLPPVDHERRWQALLGRDDTLSVLGEAEPRKADLASLLELAQSFNDDAYLAEAYFRQALFGAQTGNRPILEEASREALAAARRCGNEALETKALILVVMASIGRDDPAILLKTIEEAVHRARLLGDESVLAFVLSRAAYCSSDLDDLASWNTRLLEVVELDHRLGNRMQEAIDLGNLGVNYITLGQYKLARTLIEQARTIGEALGAHRSLAYNLLNLGFVYLSTGDVRKALLLEEQGLQEIAPTQDVRGKCVILNLLGFVLLAMGDAPGAARRFAESRELELEQALPIGVLHSIAGLATCAIMQGQLDQARDYAHEAWDYAKEHGWQRLGNFARICLACVETFDVLGEEENLQAALESGHQALMELADKINVPSWRQSFLENVPQNRALIEIWERRKRDTGTG